MVKKLLSQDFGQVLDSEKLSVVDFSAQWCGPCQMLAPVLEKLSEDISDADFFAVDIDEQRELAVKNGIEVVPTVLFVKNGKIAGKSEGYRDYDQMKALIESHI